ncbi:MAG: hypothetical protein RLZZ581_721 [Actinomycetota bacterium]|jgi:uncharacterized repeat protein (TIGR01451 family)
MKNKFPKLLFISSIFALIASAILVVPAKAQISGVSIDFAGAQPTTYNHLTGGGAWNGGTPNVDIARSLEGEDFACKDVVSYLTNISVPNTSDVQALGSMTFQLQYSFDLDTTGQSGVALSAPLSASVNGASDTASINDGNSTVSLVSSTTTGPKFSSGSELFATFNVTDVEAGETIIVRINVVVDCNPGSTPTGNLQAKLETADLIFKQGDVPVNPAEALGSGARTIDLKSTDRVLGINPAPSIDIEKTPDTQTIFDGLTANFTITVTNTGNVSLSDVAVTDAATPSCDNTWSSLAAGEVQTYTCTTVALFSALTNTAVVVGNFETTQVTDQDSAAVVIDFLPKIDVSKTGSVASLPETGGPVTFTVVVTNNSVENFILNSLVDDKFGELNGVGTCVVPQTIAAAGQYTCNFTKSLASDSLVSHTNTVTASGQDPEGNQASKGDTETITFTDVLPDISITKVANPTAARWTGDYIDYTFRITNNGAEPVAVTSFVDDKITLSAECLALVGATIAPAEYVECATNDYYLTGIPGGSFVNTATTVAQDNEANSDTATASATVNFWWYGRTPGYWKNHSELWNSGYQPTQFIQDVFNVPTNYLSNSILDLDKNGAKDTLLDGLAYRGGSALSGGAQTMFRAAIAALLNEAYYGADYPGADTTSALIALTNSKLATLNRAQLILLAGYFDFWNNAVHSSLP